MGFLAPVFLVGLLGIALPVWLHRLQTQSSERQLFGSSMLLETTEQRVHVRRKLKYLPLLALRIGLLCLLVLAFAKPFLEDSALTGAVAEAGSHLIAVDTSASMQRDAAIAAALELARDAIDAAPAGAVLQIISAADMITPVTRPSTDPVAQRSALASIVAGPGRLDFGELIATADRLAGDLPRPVTLHLVSDFQQSAMPTRFADLALEQVTTFSAHRVAQAVGANASIEYLRERSGAVEIGLADTGGHAVRLELNGELLTRHDSPSEAVLRIDNIAGVEGDNQLAAHIEGSDGFAPDNARYAVFTRVDRQPVPVISNDTSALPYTYLSAALDAGSESAFRAEPMSASDFDPRVLSRYRFVILDDIGGVDPLLEAALKEWVDAGGALLAFAGRRTAGRVTLPITGHTIAPTQASAGGSFKVGRLDQNHPMLDATDGWFAPDIADALPVEVRSDDEVLVALENDAPLLIESRQGGGKLLLVTAGLENIDNDLPIRPVFVSFLLEAARYLSGTAGVVRDYVAGERLSLPAGGGQVLDPDGVALLSLQDTAAAHSVRLGAPGIYKVLSPGFEYLVAVNSDPRESRFDAVSDAVLANWAALAGGDMRAATGVDATMPPDLIQLWPYALLLLIAFVIGESMLGNLLLAPVSPRQQGAAT
ncbi:MAG: BatA domain-containing protein [Gammaproteobacteria bacterium]|nr:BatA domain-containing protein [Gammaproteobacteria bacterium]